MRRRREIRFGEAKSATSGAVWEINAVTKKSKQPVKKQATLKQKQTLLYIKKKRINNRINVARSPLTTHYLGNGPLFLIRINVAREGGGYIKLV